MNSALARIQLQQMLDKLDRLTRTPRVTEAALDVAKQVMDQAAQLWREMVKEKKDD